MRDMCGRLRCLSPHIKEYHAQLTAAIGSFTLCSSIGTSASSVEGQNGKATPKGDGVRKYDPPRLTQVLGNSSTARLQEVTLTFIILSGALTSLCTPAFNFVEFRVQKLQQVIIMGTLYSRTGTRPQMYGVARAWVNAQQARLQRRFKYLWCLCRGSPRF